jgi:hypothetical protein
VVESLSRDMLSCCIRKSFFHYELSVDPDFHGHRGRFLPVAKADVSCIGDGETVRADAFPTS